MAATAGDTPTAAPTILRQTSPSKAHIHHKAEKLTLSAGTLLATASLDSSVRIWRVSDGTCVQTLEGPGDGVEWLQWHPKGDVVLAGSEDFTMWMWLAQSGQCMQVREQTAGQPSCRLAIMLRDHLAGPAVPALCIYID